MHFYNFNINDFNASTRHLSHLERAFYRDLIDLYYSTESGITADVTQLHRRLVIKTDDEKSALQNVLDEFFTLKNGVYRHARIEREIKNYKYRSRIGNAGNAQGNVGNAQGNVGNVSGNAQGNVSGNAQGNVTTMTNAERKEKSTKLKALIKQGIQADKGMSLTQIRTLFELAKGNVGNAQGNAQGNVGNVSGNAQGNAKNAAITNNQEPITINQEPNNISPLTPQGEQDVPFDEFWDLYDKKCDKPKCERLWAKLKPHEHAAVMAYIPHYKQSQPDKQYRKNPQTFLNNRSWENEIVTSQPTTQATDNRDFAAAAKRLEQNGNYLIQNLSRAFGQIKDVTPSNEQHIG